MSQVAGRTGTISWSATGDAGPATVLVHSLGTDHTMWAAQVEMLRARRQVITLDLPGHGSSQAASGNYTIEDVGADIVAVVDACRLETFEIVGISFGGMIALWLAAIIPDRVTALVASNTATRIGSVSFWADRIAAVASGGMDGVGDPVVARFFAPDFEQRHPDVFRRWRQVFAATDPVGYLGCCAALRDADLTTAVTSISCPALVIGGGRDVATTPEQTALLHERIAGSRFEIIPDAGHLPNLEKPEAFNRLLIGFLTG